MVTVVKMEVEKVLENALIDPEHGATKCERKYGCMTSTRNDKVLYIG